MARRLVRWISPLIILTVIIVAVIIGSIMATTTHAAGTNTPHHPATEQTTPGTAHPNSFWPG